MIWNIKKQKTTNQQQEEKRIQKKKKRKEKKTSQGQCKQPLGQLQEVQHSYHTCVPEEEKKQEIGSLFEKNNERKLPYLVKEIDMQIQEAQGVKAALPNTQTQTQGRCQIEETKKHGPNERTNQNSRKRAR